MLFFCKAKGSQDSVILLSKLHALSELDCSEQLFHSTYLTPREQLYPINNCWVFSPGGI